MTDAQYDAKFAVWQAQVAKIIKTVTGLDIDDLPDWDYASAFEEGISPRQAALSVIEDAS